MMMALAGLVALTGCAAPKAAIDYTYADGITWPGGGLKPRVRYLWSLSRISGAGEAGAVGLPSEYPSEDLQELDFLVRPHSVFVSSDDIIYITDPDAARVSVVDLKTMDSFNILGFDFVNFSSPIGVVGTSGGNVYISDSDLRAVGMFNREGKFLELIRGEFERPTGLAIDEKAGRLYISDTWAHKILIYGLDGSPIGSFGEFGEGPGQLNYPTHLAVGPEGRIYVSDTLNFRVQIFSPDGELVGGFGLPGDIYGHFDKIKGIAVDSEGHIYIVDSRLDMVQIYDRQGRLLLFFGESGTFYGQFRLPAGIFIDGRDRIFVADGLNRRVQTFQFLGGE